MPVNFYYHWLLAVYLKWELQLDEARSCIILFIAITHTHTRSTTSFQDNLVKPVPEMCTFLTLLLFSFRLYMDGPLYSTGVLFLCMTEHYKFYYVCMYVYMYVITLLS